MRQLFVRFLDAFIPADINEFEQSEEIVRARSLVFLLVFNVIIAGIMILSTPFGGVLPEDIQGVSLLAQSAAIFGYLLALGIFAYSGLFGVSGNVYALVTYSSTLGSVLAFENQSYTYFILILISLPLIISLVANHLSAILWLFLVAITPQVLIQMGNTYISEYFVTGWVACCLGIFFAVFMQHYYRETMHARLNSERGAFEFAAAHDPLTGVANRATFDKRLQESIERCSQQGTKAVLVYIDLDKFKPINDNYGHHAGDIVLTTVAERLRQLVRASDTVARLGGDEFAILFQQCSPQAIQPLIDRIGAVIAAPIQVYDARLEVGCSLGVVVCPDDGQTASRLAQMADQRMYAQKRQEDDNSLSEVSAAGR